MMSELKETGVIPYFEIRPKDANGNTIFTDYCGPQDIYK